LARIPISGVRAFLRFWHIQDGTHRRYAMLNVVMILAAVLVLAGLFAGVRLFIYLVSGQADIDARFDAYCK
jgi:uncharacterized membrane protein